LSYVLDALARHEIGVAADIIGQRLKSIEKYIVDGSWQKGQYLELVPPENGTLIDREEESMLSKELEIDLKLQAGRPPQVYQGGWKSDAQQPWSWNQGKGKDQSQSQSSKGDYKGKGKDKNKGKKGGWRQKPTEQAVTQEKTPTVPAEREAR
jgi:hypothetical protein